MQTTGHDFPSMSPSRGHTPHDLGSDLNQQQREALEHLEGPLLILAGAGSGKTRVLTYRIAQTILSAVARPEQIWATTFTNKAAAEMRTRVHHLLVSKGIRVSELPWVSTFHSSGAEILRRYGAHLGIRMPFSIYDDSDQLALLKNVLDDLKISEKQWNPKALRHGIDQLKNRGLTPEDFASQATTFDKEVLYRVYMAYQAQLRANQALDFGDLLVEPVQLLKNFPQVKEELQRKYTHFLVDEFQDTNAIQYAWIKLLSERTKNLCVVGDEDQSIYAWRGADIGNILNFQKDFPDARIVKLERNYRSTRNIVTAASKVIAHNTQRWEKTLYSDGDAGDPIQLIGVPSEHDEATAIVQDILRRQQQGLDLKEVAIFYRTNAQSRVLEERLRASRLPYQVYGGLRFYDRAEIKDAVAYLRLAVNPRDEIAFVRVVNNPTRGVGKTSLEKVFRARGRFGGDLIETAANAEEVTGKARAGLNFFAEHIRELALLSGQCRPPIEVFSHWWVNSGYVDVLRAEDSVEAEARLENLTELENAVREYMGRVTTPTIAGFLDEISLYTDRVEEKADRELGVNLMTLHSSKGLEFDCVYVCGLEEGLFPSQRAIEENTVEEERRLFYVGMTRARLYLHILFAHQRMSYGVLQPRLTSRFLDELPQEGVIQRGMEMRRPRATAPWDEVAQVSTHEGEESHVSYDDGVPAFQKGDDRRFKLVSELTGTQRRYRRGLKVRHSEYGIGIIRKCEGNPGHERLVVAFEYFGERKFMAQYAQLEVLGK